MGINTVILPGRCLRSTGGKSVGHPGAVQLGISKRIAKENDSHSLHLTFLGLCLASWRHQYWQARLTRDASYMHSLAVQPLLSIDMAEKALLTIQPHHTLGLIVQMQDNEYIRNLLLFLISYVSFIFWREWEPRRIWLIRYAVLPLHRSYGTITWRRFRASSDPPPPMWRPYGPIYIFRLSSFVSVELPIFLYSIKQRQNGLQQTGGR